MKRLYWLLPLFGLIICFLWALHAHYPLFVHDLGYHIGHLLGGRWHFARQGLLPFWYSPHFCGGMPMFGNPQSMYYSIPQLLTFSLNPWPAILLSMITMLILGYAGWWFFGKNVLRLKAQWAHLLALIISANGFFFLHMITGHLVFMTVPLVGWFLWLLFGDEIKKLRACTFALLAALVIYGAGYLTILFTIFAFPFALIVDLFFHRSEFRKRIKVIAARIGCCGGLSLLLVASKLIAITSVMRTFPRTMPFDRFAEEASTFGYITRSLFAIPQHPKLYEPLGLPLGIHELSMFLSPVVLCGLVALIIITIQKRWWQKHGIFLVSCAGGIFTLVFFVQLVRGYGALVSPLEHLPIFSSIHVTTRFLYPFSLLLSAIGVLGLSLYVQSGKWKKYERRILSAATWITVLALPLAYGQVIISDEHFNWAIRYNRIHEKMEETDWLSRPVESARWGGTFPFHVTLGTTGVRCYEPLYGYRGEHQVTSLTQGPVDLVRDGEFNLLNPACLQYPKQNNCEPGDKIATSDRENFENFRRGERVTWKLSSAQRWSNWISLIALVGCVSGLVWKVHIWMKK